MIDLYTSPTPNGWKITVLLEELALPYTLHAIDLSKNEQKEDWFLAMNPNGRIPVIKDRDSADFVVFESGAILLYLAEKANHLLGQTDQEKSQITQWLMFQMGGLGPMMGQANVFYRYFPEKIPAAIDRYQHEGRRLLTVLNDHLAERDYLVGHGVGQYSIADIANWCWAHTYAWSGISIDGLTHLQVWLERIRQRPAVQRGIQLPARPDPSDVAAAGRQLIQK